VQSPSASENSTNLRCVHTAHLTRGFSHTPGRHSLAHRGPTPSALAASDSPSGSRTHPGVRENRLANNATRPSAVAACGPPARRSSSASSRASWSRHARDPEPQDGHARAATADRPLR
jgi:hypothetical protein